MNQKEVMKMIRALDGDIGWVIHHLVEEIVDQNSTASNAEIGEEIRKTIKSIRAVKKKLVRMENSQKIKKIKNKIRVFENDIQLMKKQLQVLQDTK